jgi:hypothetical protein
VDRNEYTGMIYVQCAALSEDAAVKVASDRLAQIRAEILEAGGHA